MHTFFTKEKQEDLKRQITDDVEAIKETLCLQECGSKIFFKNLTDANENISDIEACIKKFAPLQSLWEQALPAHWIEMERNILKTARRTPVLKYKDVKDLAKSADFESSLFIKYLRTSRLALTIKPDCFQPDDDIVINPQWLINAFRQVIDIDDSAGPVNRIKSPTRATLVPDAVDIVWKDERFENHIPILLMFMENFGLLTKPLNGAEYFIPSLMKCHSDAGEITKWLDPSIRFISKTLVLDFRKDDQQIPFPHFDKLMAEFISQQTSTSVKYFKRDCCIVRMKSFGFVLHHGCSIVKITLFSNKADEGLLYSGSYGGELRQNVEDISNDINRRFNEIQIGNPRRGLSCKYLCPDESTAIKYRPVEEIVADVMDCCDDSCCPLVEPKDLQVWGLGLY